MPARFQVPPVLYRGHGGTDVRRSKQPLPTFTDCKDIAAVYASDQPDGRVQAVHLDITNPLVLGDTCEDVVEIGNLKASLVGPGKVEEWEFEEWANLKSFWRFGGDEIDIDRPPESDSDGNPYKRELVYTDTYRIADDAQFVGLAQKAGFDGFAYRGTFTSDDRFLRPTDEIERTSSYDEITRSSMEFRPFSLNQIEECPWSSLSLALMPAPLEADLAIARAAAVRIAAAPQMAIA